MGLKDVVASTYTRCITSPPASGFTECVGQGSLLSQWQEPVGGDFVNDTFDDVAGVLLQNHVGEVGADWDKHPSYAGGGNVSISSGKRAYGTLPAPTAYFASGLPLSADYLVQAILRWLGSVTQDGGIMARVSTSANTHYLAWYNSGQFSPFVAQWELWRFLAGSGTLLGTFLQTLSSDTPYKLGLRIVGADIRLFVDDVQRIQHTDATPITAAGRPGLRFFNIGISSSDIVGLHLDNFLARPIAA